MNLEQLQTQHAELIGNLCGNYTEGADIIVEQIRANERAQKTIKIALRLESVNREQAKLREQARLVWDIEEVTPDVITQDGTPHATKVKKFPVLRSFEYVRVIFNKAGKLEAVKTGLKTWQLLPYNQNERPETFEDFLKLNSVQPADITPEELSAVIERNEQINAEFKAACEKFSADKDALKIHTYSYLGLFTQHNAGHNYEYLVNY